MQDNHKLPEPPSMLEGEYGSRTNALKHEVYVQEMPIYKKEAIASILREEEAIPTELPKVKAKGF
jgi:DNA-directed RNA polymerase subunit H (RpoH/RPB5)